jgi:hypothetical protein
LADNLGAADPRPRPLPNATARPGTAGEGRLCGDQLRPTRKDTHVRILVTIPGVPDLLGPTPPSEIGDMSLLPIARQPVGATELDQGRTK